MLVLDHNPLRPVGKCSGKVSHPVNFSRGQTPKQLGNYSDNCATCCIRDEGRPLGTAMQVEVSNHLKLLWTKAMVVSVKEKARQDPVSYTHLRAHETRHDLVCRLLLEKKKQTD